LGPFFHVICFEATFLDGVLLLRRSLAVFTVLRRVDIHAFRGLQRYSLPFALMINELGRPIPVLVLYTIVTSLSAFLASVPSF